MNGESAETVALEALAYLAADERRLGALLAQAGWTLAELRAQAQEPYVLAGILDFLVAHEPFLVGFCEERAYTPNQVESARRVLSATELG